MPTSATKLLLDLGAQYNEVWYYIHASITGRIIQILEHQQQDLYTQVIVHDLETFEAVYPAECYTIRH